MKKEIKISILILIGFLSFLWLEVPLKKGLILLQVESLLAKQISGIVIRTILIVIAISLIKKFDFKNFTGLNSWHSAINIQAAFVPLAFIFMGFLGNWNTYINTEALLLFLFMLSTLAVGIVEELIFRGTVFPFFIQVFADKKSPILISAILSSLMFGAVHFINLFSQPDNLAGITSQVFFALAIGVFFCGLMVRTENILIPCLLHALINFSFGAGELKESIETTTSDISESTGVNWSSIIPTTIFFTFIFLGGVYMILNCNKENILTKLNIKSPSTDVL